MSFNDNILKSSYNAIDIKFRSNSISTKSIEVLNNEEKLKWINIFFDYYQKSKLKGKIVHNYYFDYIYYWKNTTTYMNNPYKLLYYKNKFIRKIQYLFW